MNKVELKFKKLKETAELPKAWTDGSVGLDLYAHIISAEGRPRSTNLPAHVTMSFETGLSIEPPPGYMLFVCSRSGMAAQSIVVTNAPGLIDPDYRGEIKVLLTNLSFIHYTIKHGDRIAQIVAVPATFLQPLEAAELTKTERGDRGFGSTGI